MTGRIQGRMNIFLSHIVVLSIILKKYKKKQNEM